MNNTNWYLGVRGEKTALTLPWQKEEPSIPPAAAMGAGAALGAGGAGMYGTGMYQKAFGNTMSDFAETGKMRGGLVDFSNKFNPGYADDLGAVFQKDPKLLAKIGPASKRMGKVMRGGGLAGLLGGAGLAGYGAYQALGGD